MAAKNGAPPKRNNGCAHERTVVVSPLSWQWTPKGVRAKGRCIDCGFEGMVLSEGTVRGLSAASLRWNTDNVTETGREPVDPLVGSPSLIAETKRRRR